MCMIVFGVCYRPVSLESLLGFGVSSGEFRDMPFEPRKVARIQRMPGKTGGHPEEVPGQDPQEASVGETYTSSHTRRDPAPRGRIYYSHQLEFGVNKLSCAFSKVLRLIHPILNLCNILTGGGVWLCSPYSPTSWLGLFPRRSFTPRDQWNINEGVGESC